MDPGKKKGRGTRSKASQEARRRRFVDEVVPRFLEKVAKNSSKPHRVICLCSCRLTMSCVFFSVHFVACASPEDFRIRPSSQAQVVSKVASKFHTHPNLLKPYPPEGNFFLSSPIKGHTCSARFLVMRFDKVFDDDVNKLLIKTWDSVVNFGLKFSEKRLVRSRSKQLHVGIWEQYMMAPAVTLDSRSQNEGAEVALDAFLACFQQHVTSRLNNLLYRYDRTNWLRQQT